AEVHLVTSDLQPDFPNYHETYEPFLGSRQRETGVYRLDNFTVHRLAHGSQRHGIYLPGLHQKIVELKPQGVQCFSIPTFSTYQVAASKLLLGYKLFLEEHMHASVFTYPKTWKYHLYYALYPRTIGKFLSINSKLCYPIATDVAEIAVKYYGYDP